MKKIKDLYVKEVLGLNDSDWEGEDGDYTPVKFNLFFSGTKNPRKPKIYIYRISFKLKNLFF